MTIEHCENVCVISSDENVEEEELIHVSLSMGIPRHFMCAKRARKLSGEGQK